MRPDAFLLLGIFLIRQVFLNFGVQCT